MPGPSALSAAGTSSSHPLVLVAEARGPPAGEKRLEVAGPGIDRASLMKARISQLARPRAQVPVELIHVSLLYRRSVLMPNPSLWPGTPEGQGQEEALSSRNSFADMAAPPWLRCGEGQWVAGQRSSPH